MNIRKNLSSRNERKRLLNSSKNGCKTRGNAIRRLTARLWSKFEGAAECGDIRHPGKR